MLKMCYMENGYEHQTLILLNITQRQTHLGEDTKTKGCVIHTLKDTREKDTETKNYNVGV